MGNNDLHDGTAEPQEETYSVISFPGSEIPEQYKGLIYSRWLRSHRYGNMLFKLIDSDVYYDKYANYLTELLNRAHSMVRLAVLTADHDIVLGFCVHRGPILDYVHVQHLLRGQRIASKLVPDKIKCITHWTYMGERFATQRYGRWTFNPFA